MNCSGSDLLGQKLLKVLVYLNLLYCFVGEGLFFLFDDTVEPRQHAPETTFWKARIQERKSFVYSFLFYQTLWQPARVGRIFITHAH